MELLAHDSKAPMKSPRSKTYRIRFFWRYKGVYSKCYFAKMTRSLILIFRKICSKHRIIQWFKWYWHKNSPLGIVTISSYGSSVFRPPLFVVMSVFHLCFKTISDLFHMVTNSHNAQRLLWNQTEILFN